MKRLYGRYGDVYRLIPLVSKLAKARPYPDAIFVCMRHPTDCISILYRNREWLQVQWYRYFHEAKDEMFFSTRRSQVEQNISSITEWK